MNSEFNKIVFDLTDRECMFILMTLYGAFEENKEFMDYFEKVVAKQIGKREET